MHPTFLNDSKVKANIQKSSQNFSQMVDFIKAGSLSSAVEPVVLFKPTTILTRVGIPNAKITYSQSKMKTNIAEHNLTYEEIKKIPELLANPEYIFESVTDPEGFVAVLTNEKTPLIVAITKKGKEYKVKNIIKSSYHKGENFILDNINNQRCLYNKSNPTRFRQHRALIAQAKTLSDNNIITDKKDNFNPPEKYQQKKPSPFVRKDEPIVRGSLTIDSKTGKAIIDVLKSGDESTIPHELAHFYMNAVETLAQQDNARAQKELEEINNWLGKQADIEYTQDELIEFDEKFARGFEAYLREGIAPTDNLGRVFIKFRNWLRDIYKSAEDLDVPMNEDTKKFFDRIFTTDKEFNELYKKNSKFLFYLFVL